MFCLPQILFSILLLFDRIQSRLTEPLCVDVSPPNVTCGFRGSLKRTLKGKSYDLGQPQVVTSVEECAEICAGRVVNSELHQKGGKKYSGYCNSIQYDTNTSECNLGRFLLRPTYITSNESSPFTYYSRQCFDCGSVFDQPYNTQLLVDGGFEDGSLLGPWNVNNGNITTPGHESSRAFNCSSPSYGSCSITQQFNHLPNEMYALRFFFKDLRKNNAVGDLIVNINSNSNFVRRRQLHGRDSPTPDTYVAEYHYIFDLYNAPKTAVWNERWIFAHTLPEAYLTNTGNYENMLYGIDLSIQQNAQDLDVAFDDVLVMRIPQNLSTKGDNLFTNGNFETGSTSPFYVGNDVGKLTSPGIDSNYALKLEDFPLGYLDYSNIPTNPGTQYLFSFDMHLTLKDAYLELKVELGNGDYDGTYNEYFYDQDGSFNFTFTLPFVAFDTETYLTVVFDSYALQGAHNPRSSVLVDNFSFRELRLGLGVE